MKGHPRGGLFFWECLMRAIFPELRQVRMIPGAGHMVQLEASAEVNTILLEFLGDIERSNSPDLQL